MKNIAQPVRVWALVREATPTVSGAPLPLPDRPSIAVLPFDNLSGQPEETYFSDGITEDIITGLARFRSLFVIARNPSFAFRGKVVEMAEIGRRLGAPRPNPGQQVHLVGWHQERALSQAGQAQHTHYSVACGGYPRIHRARGQVMARRRACARSRSMTPIRSTKPRAISTSRRARSRGGFKSGLPCLKEQRPFLILGQDLIEFLKASAPKKHKLGHANARANLPLAKPISYLISGTADC